MGEKNYCSPLGVVKELEKNYKCQNPIVVKLFGSKSCTGLDLMVQISLQITTWCYYKGARENLQTWRGFSFLNAAINKFIQEKKNRTKPGC